MTLNRFVIIAFIAASVLVAFIGVQAMHTWSVSSHVMRVTQRALEITTMGGDLSQLVDEYIVEPHERPVQQWKILVRRSQLVFEQLQEEGVPAEEVARFRQDIAQADHLFDIIVKDTPSRVLAALITTRRSRFTEQLQIRMRTLTIRANRLHRDSLDLQQRVRFNQLIFNGSIGGVLIISIGIIYVFFRRSVIGPIRMLHAATARSAEGDLKAAPVPDGGGELGELTSSFNAMIAQLGSSRQQLLDESASRAGETRLRELSDALPHLIWAAQPDGQIDYYNQRWVPLLAGRELIGSSWLEHVNPTDRKSVSLHWEAALRDGKPFDCELRLSHGTTWRWHTIRIAPLFDRSGHIVRWVGTASDSEDRKRFEDDLRQSRHRAEVLHQLGLNLASELESDETADHIVSAAVLLTAAECCLLQIRLSGSGRDDGQTFGAGPFQERYPWLVSDLGKLPTTNFEPIRIDDLSAKNERRHFPIPIPDLAVGSLVAVPITSHRGLTNGWLVCVHNARYHFSTTDEEVLIGVAALAAIVLDNAQLFTGERLAKRVATARSAELTRSNAELQQFAYVASHDLREPLRMMSNFLGILDQQYGPQLDDRARRFVSNALSASQRMHGLIQDLLDYSLVGARPDPVDVVAVGSAVDTALRNLAQEIDSAKATVEIGDLPVVRYRQSQMIQLTQNLVGNAVKFRGDRQPVISITAGRIEYAWRISVRDNGIGIAPHHHQRIFSMFQRLHGRDQYDGTGIGLTICKKIVEFHGGEIGVESNPEGGSHFWFTVPDYDGHRDQTPATGARQLN